MRKVAAFVILLVLCSCAREKERSAFINDRAVNNDLVSARYFSEAAAVSFRVPAGFRPISGNLFESIRRDMAKSASKKFPSDILALWADETGRSVMILSLPKYADDGVSPEELALIRNEYSANLSGSAIFSTASTHESLAVQHFKVIHKRVVYYKLIFSGRGNGFELSFITPLESFSDMMDKYSSVFASVAQLK